jgi:hypothetical protein
MLKKHFRIQPYAWKQNIFFYLLKKEINLKVLRFFEFFLEIFRMKPSILILDLYLTV